MPIKKIETHAIIIGAGPAGAATSIFLSKHGIPHVVIERESFPRDKVCGDAFSTRSIQVLGRADPNWLDQIFGSPGSFKSVNGAIFICPDGRKINIPFGKSNIPGHAPGFTASRLLFDYFLFNKMCSTASMVFERTSMNSIERNGGKIKVEFAQGSQQYEIEAYILVGADGEKSKVKKILMSKSSPNRGHSVAVRAYYKGVSGFDSLNYIELFYLTEILPGYLWIFPLPKGMANVGLGSLTGKVRRERINLRKNLTKLVNSNPIIKERFKNATLIGNIQGWSIPMNIKREAVSGDNFLLTGDAASLVNPFSGEGIGNALYSGMTAADAINKCVEKDQYDADFLSRAYDEILYRDLGAELNASAMMQRIFNIPWLFRYLVKKVHKSQTLQHAVSTMFNETDLYTELGKPSFYIKVLLNR